MAVHAELMPAAIVLGMSPHGLAIARALARNGIHVLAFEQALSLPAVATRYATVRQANALNTAYAADILLKYREERGAARPAVLFASSDNIIRAIADRWSELRTGYRTSWAPSVALVAKLIDKSNLEAICRERGLDYPASVLMTDVSDIPSAIAAVGFPLLAKPVRPLSGFKAMRIDNRAALELLAERQVADLPFLIQRWIPGGDDTLYFCSMVLDQGRPVAAFTGRKVEAYPPGTGVGTIVESWHDQEVLGLAHRFIEGLDLSGPIAIEFKRDPQGKFWLIEPNVGRTEYSVDLIIQSGINFPLLEYQLALGLPLTAPAVQRREVVWYDTDRDPLCYLRRCRREGSLRPRSKQRVFPYWGHADAGPLWRATRRFTAKVLAKFREVVEPDAARHGVRVERVARAADLPEEARQLISQLTGGNIFLSPAWFEIFEREVALHEGPHFWALIYGPGAPFMERGRSWNDDREAGVSCARPGTTTRPT